MSRICPDWRHFTSSDLLLSGICYVGKETKILGDAEDVLEEEDAEISFPGSLVSDCLPVLHENFSTFSQTKKKIYSIVVICYSIEREKQQSRHHPPCDTASIDAKILFNNQIGYDHLPIYLPTYETYLSLSMERIN